MKSFVQAVQEAEMTTKKEGKFAALTGIDQNAKRLMVEALSVFRIFGVKKYDIPLSYASNDADIAVFFSLLDQLHNRQLTGNAAREAVTQTLSKFTKTTAEYLMRVIDKDLKAGFSETTLNKIYPGLVPVFGIMLAAKVDDKYKWEFPLIADGKYDGQRMLSIVDESSIDFFGGREGKIAEWMYGITEIETELHELEKLAGIPLAVDGEMMARNFTETMNAKKLSNKEARDNLNYYVFDIMSREAWRSQASTKTNIERRVWLTELINKGNFKRLKLSHSKIVHNMDEVREFFFELVNKGLDGYKFEGLIIKKPNALYEWKRSKSWAKWKPIQDFDLVIYDFYEGRPGTKYEGTLGGVMGKGYDENGNYIETNIGSGFSDDMRDEIYHNFEKYRGQVAKIEGQELSMAENREDVFSIRFPVFCNFRDDKTAEEVLKKPEL